MGELLDSEMVDDGEEVQAEFEDGDFTISSSNP